MNQKEIWKDVPNYEGIYQVSSLGRIKSLKYNKERFLKKGVDGRGYENVKLCSRGVGKTYNVHRLVAICFLNHKPNGMALVVNHKNFNRVDNRVENLEIVTARENTNKKHLKSTSKYTGVSWSISTNKWQVHIKYGNKSKYLGCYKSEKVASAVYEYELESISNN